eukprot:1160679-Pelagomonas_calceolata.AAC.18
MRQNTFACCLHAHAGDAKHGTRVKKGYLFVPEQVGAAKHPCTFCNSGRRTCSTDERSRNTGRRGQTCKHLPCLCKHAGWERHGGQADHTHHHRCSRCGGRPVHLAGCAWLDMCARAEYGNGTDDDTHTYLVVVSPHEGGAPCEVVRQPHELVYPWLGAHGPMVAAVLNRQACNMRVLVKMSRGAQQQEPHPLFSPNDVHPLSNQNEPHHPLFGQSAHSKEMDDTEHLCKRAHTSLHTQAQTQHAPIHAPASPSSVPVSTLVSIAYSA